MTIQLIYWRDGEKKNTKSGVMYANDNQSKPNEIAMYVIHVIHGISIL